MVSTFSSMKVLNSLGASSGCKRAGTQKSLEGSSSSEKCCGGAGTLKDWKEGRSGSAVLTSMDMRRIACRLLSSWARPAGLDSYSKSWRGNCCLAVSELVLVRGGGESFGAAGEDLLASGVGVPLGGPSCCIWARRGDFGGAEGKGLKGSRLSPRGLLMKLRGRELRFSW